MNDASSPAVPVALCLGGMDPSAGAGILRDVMTLAALGVHPMALSTADTVQNGRVCLAIRPPRNPLPAFDALVPHLGGPWGVKLGLCALDPDTLRDLTIRLEAQGPSARIWDPILAPTSGVGLHDPGALRAMAGILLRSGPWVVSPNLPEAAALAGLPTDADPGRLARPLLDLGAGAVWLKGGHGALDQVEDFWVTAGGVRSLGRHPRLPGDRRGTGCTLASAWLGFRLKGLEDADAAQAAGTFLRAAWEPGARPGGQGRPCFAPGGRA
ncbi:bifunctional hydroxymethylpyrimidine kinase/phosphomethylpyrimidine kinase [Mesoterricola silvestris]|uniref:Hydroxymethylpyrimidine/phosphomethylpyrimidine kinase n=1 Tax=Mesoterricola silvestris TaxID=2927979 RepID=A0AA48GG50_9BACT|nr:bifunctional hydroxymethylpyrimidine kinase/phosphomethylpyrimidine kinase [Mesoterricola silvestris]BDU72146.1 hydroxymethylpyrimidine/phosphomethylpyrimidine kinase [Mesoterricola silvestris]